MVDSDLSGFFNTTVILWKICYLQKDEHDREQDQQRIGEHTAQG